MKSQKLNALDSGSTGNKWNWQDSKENENPKKPEIPGVHLSYLLFLDFFKMELNNNRSAMRYYSETMDINKAVISSPG